jgi:hypothetical protein
VRRSLVLAGGAQADAGEAAAHHPRPPPQEVQVCGAVQQTHQGDQEDSQIKTILQSFNQIAGVGVGSVICEAVSLNAVVVRDPDPDRDVALQGGPDPDRIKNLGPAKEKPRNTCT